MENWESVSSSYISNQLRNKRNWALATLMTVLSRLVDKGFLYCEKEGRSNSYRAAISETDYKECEGNLLLKNYSVILFKIW